MARGSACWTAALALAACCFPCSGNRGSPIEKVVTMLEDMRTEILVEGKAEAKTYDKFACFCKDMTSEKTDAIQTGQDIALELEAELAGAFTKREKYDKQISEVVTIIGEKDKGLGEAKAQREKDRKEFKIAEDDCFVFKKELDWAVVELMASEEGIDTSGMNLGGFIEVKATVEKAWSAGPAGAEKALRELETAHPHLKPHQRQLIRELLQIGQTQKHVGSVVKKVKELKPGMEDTLKRLRADEVQSKHMYQMVVQGLTDEKKVQEKTMNNLKKEQSANTQLLSQNQRDLTYTNAMLSDDQAYLSDLTEKCNIKSKMWDQRSAARASELTAITEALTIINEQVATKVSDKTVRLVTLKKVKQASNSAGPVEAELELGMDAGSESDSDDAYDSVLDVADEREEASFLQLQQETSPRKKALSLLRHHTHFHHHRHRKRSPLGGLRDMVRHENAARFLKKQQEINSEMEQESSPLQKQLDAELALDKKREQMEAKERKEEEAEGAVLKAPADDGENPMEDLKKDKETKARKTIVNLLKTDASHLHSKQIAALAAQVSGSPFDKITKLIQELIERLNQEAQDEANHQGWCKKQMTLAKEQRARKALAVKDLNDILANTEVKRNNLVTEIDTLTSEITELEEALAKMTKERDEESGENEATIKEAQEGQEAVEEAIDLLDKFYKTAAKNEVFAQTAGVDDDMPDAGFDGAYTGSQSSNKGVLGMMQVIRDDFQRTVTTTKAAEAEAQKDFLSFDTKSKMSIKEKTNIKNAKDSELIEVKDQLSTDKESMFQEQSLLDKSLQELIELQPACVPTVMPYAERVAKREQEIKSLKTALCTLDKQGPVQTEDATCSGLDV